MGKKLKMQNSAALKHKFVGLILHRSHANDLPAKRQSCSSDTADGNGSLTVSTPHCVCQHYQGFFIEKRNNCGCVSVTVLLLVSPRTAFVAYM